MNKAQECANLAYESVGEISKGSIWDRYYYNHVLRKCRRAAKKGYTGRCFSDTFFNPIIENRLKNEKFMLKHKAEFKSSIQEEIGEVYVDWEQ